MDSISHETHAEPAADRDIGQPSSGPFTSGIASEDMIRGVATVGAIGVAVALVEVALIPGMVIGVAAAFAPKYIPKMVDSAEPFFRSTIRGLYKFNRKARETVAEAHEKVLDIVAEVHTEEAAAPVESASHSHA